MGKRLVDKKNYDKFILKGSLAVEGYNDVDNKYEQLFVEYNKKLSQYRDFLEQRYKKRDEIAEELMKLMETIGIENFTIYDDGDVEYNYESRKD